MKRSWQYKCFLLGLGNLILGISVSAQRDTTKPRNIEISSVFKPMLRGAAKINLNATGTVTFASLSGNKYKPDGTLIGSATGAGQEDFYGAGAYAYPTYGNVVYKIGESGEVKRAGGKYNGSAVSSGMLYISIYETVYNASNTGSYNVVISVK